MWGDLGVEPDSGDEGGQVADAARPDARGNCGEEQQEIRQEPSELHRLRGDLHPELLTPSLLLLVLAAPLFH